MVDATRVFEPGFQVTNAAGTPQSGAVLRFYAAGTDNPRTVYSDFALSTSLGVTVTTNASGRPAASAGLGAEILIYTGTSAYGVSAETSAGVILWSFDNVIGALDTSSFLTGTVTAETPVVAKTANYTIVNGDQGKVINANPTGGAFTLTMPNAVTVGDGWSITIRHTGTAGQVKITTVASQTMNGFTARSLVYQYETITIVSDGANWHIIGSAQGFNTGRVPTLYIEDRDLASPPGSPTAGARYLVAASPSGGWSTFDQHDVAEADGQGSWLEIDPVEGWRAYLKDEDIELIFTGSAWVRVSQLPRGYIDGLVTSNGSDATNDINIAVGACRDSSDTHDIRITTALVKQLDADWAAGTNAGMRYSGAAIANTTYHLFAILNPTTGASDVFAYAASTDPTAVLPSGYTKFRRIGSIVRASAAIILYTQVGDQFYPKAPIMDLDSTSVTTAVTTATLASIPNGLTLDCRLAVIFSHGSGAYVYFKATGDTDSAPSTTASPLAQIGSGGADTLGGYVEVRVDTARQFTVRSTASSTTVRAACTRWTDWRGRDA